MEHRVTGRISGHEPQGVFDGEAAVAAAGEFPPAFEQGQLVLAVGRFLGGGPLGGQAVVAGGEPDGAADGGVPVLERPECGPVGPGAGRRSRGP